MKVPLTVAGAEKMREELEHLKRVERPQVIDAIATAREHGDLKENAEYHAAKEQQGFIEGRIKDLEYKLSNAQIVDITKVSNNGKVVFGATVKLLDVDNDEDLSYKIVGEDEADFKNNMISVGSPIARNLIGKVEGDSVQIEVPGGKREFEILEVLYI